MSSPLRVTDALVIPARDLRWTAVRASGPGGQNVNKVASKVELRFDLAGTDALRDDVKERLRALAGRHVDAEGKVVLRSDRTRDQLRNLEDARERLRQLVLRALVVPKRRRPTKPSRAARTRRLEDKRHAAAKKRARGSAGLDA